jgi:parallel beta helix pectate lyase-like protein
MFGLRVHWVIMWILAVIWLSSAADGKTVYVNGSCGDDSWSGTDPCCIGPDGPKKTIQEGIDVAEPCDVVIVYDGTYRGLGNRDIDFKGKSITVRGKNGPNNTLIDCEGYVGDPHRGFIFHNDEGADSVLDGFGIFYGFGDVNIIDGKEVSLGGGIYCYQSDPTIRNCNIVYNQAGYYDGMSIEGLPGWGAGVCCLGGSPLIYNCVIYGNVTSDRGSPTVNPKGGGIYAGASSCLSVRKCTIGANFAPSGGGIYCEDSSLEIRNSIIEKNDTCSGGGGGILVQPECSLLMEMCLVSNNYAFFTGGGIACMTDDAIIKNSTICGNILEGLYRPPFFDNPAQGGGIYCGTSSPQIINCTIHMNVLPVYPEVGGIYGEGSPTIKNCIVWGNDNVEISCGLPVSYCDVQDGYPGPGNINVEPDFVYPGYWSWGGTWIGGNYHLKSQARWWDSSAKIWTQDEKTSLCIDAGEPWNVNYDPNLATDWRGELWPHGGRINMGTLGGTAQASMSLDDTVGNVADLNVDGVVDLEDMNIFSRNFMIVEHLLKEDMDRNGVVDMADVLFMAEHWLWKE